MRSGYLALAICSAGLVMGVPSGAVAAVLIFGSNAYSYVGISESWFQAKADANASIYNGVNGHLATVTSGAENSFLLSLAPPGTTRWLMAGGQVA